MQMQNIYSQFIKNMKKAYAKKILPIWNQLVIYNSKHLI